MDSPSPDGPFNGRRTLDEAGRTNLILRVMKLDLKRQFPPTRQIPIEPMATAGKVRRGRRGPSGSGRESAQRLAGSPAPPRRARLGRPRGVAGVQGGNA